jgi:hypothetical protein
VCYKTFPAKEAAPGPEKGPGDNNWANFIAALRTRKPQDLNAEIESTATR